MDGYTKVRKEYPGIFGGMTDEEVHEEILSTEDCPGEFGLKENENGCNADWCNSCIKDSLEAEYPEEGE